MDKLRSIIKQVMREESGTGGGALAGSFTPGEGPQTATKAGTDAAYKKILILKAQQITITIN